MFNRVSVNILLKAVIGLLTATTMVLLVVGAWSSWNGLRTATHIAHITDTSVYLFSALQNSRLDRSGSVRELAADTVNGPSEALRGFRNTAVPALKAGLAALREVRLPQGEGDIDALDRAIARLAVLHQESAAALTQPKALRRADLSKELQDHLVGLVDLLAKISAKLVNAVKLDDAYVSQVMQLKQMAWIARGAAGDAMASLPASSNPPVPPDRLQVLASNFGRAETAWDAVEEFAAGLSLPAPLVSAIQAGRKGFFDPAFRALSFKTMNSLIAGEKYDGAEWVKVSLPRVIGLQAVSELALQTVKDHAADLRAKAQARLVIELSLLSVALVLAFVMMAVISRRVIAPLKMIQSVMLTIAGGDFTINLPRLTRQDEVGQIIMSVSAMVEQIRTTIGEIKTSAREVTNASAEIATTTTDLSQRTEEQGKSVV